MLTPSPQDTIDNIAGRQRHGHHLMRVCCGSTILLKIKVGAEGGDDEGFILKVIDGYMLLRAMDLSPQYCEILIPSLSR